MTPDVSDPYSNQMILYQKINNNKQTKKNKTWTEVESDVKKNL